MSSHHVSPAVVRAWSWLTHPSRATWIGASLLLVVAIAVARWLLCDTLPVFLWSKDSESYASSAWTWLDRGNWTTDPKRGPMYSVVIAWWLKVAGTFWSLIVLQHVIGGLCIAAGCAVLFRLAGSRAWLPATLCALSYGLYSVPLHLEHLVRNETVLFSLATATLIAWWLALQRDSIAWLAVTGVSLSLLTLTKNVFTPLPLVVLVALGVLGWRHRIGWRLLCLRAATFILAFVLPTVAVKLARRAERNPQASRPQEWLLLYGRVAQFTVLDGGIEPEIKQLIRDDILDYRKRGDDLDNNIILHRTAVPRMERYLAGRGGTPTDLNQLCRRLAFEAIAANPQAYSRQVRRDITQLLTRSGERSRRPDESQVSEAIKALKGLSLEHPSLRLQTTLTELDAHRDDRNFRAYHRLVRRGGWLFSRSPVLLTTLLLPFVWWQSQGVARWWWLSLGAVWYFNMVLLCTVGRPMDRYLISVVPVMFWTLGMALALAWNAGTRFVERKVPALAPSSP